MQQFLEAISDPTRRRILDLLRQGEKSVGELMEHFEISGASMSHHLNKLKSTGLVQDTRRGQHIYYAINTSVFEDTAQVVIEFLKTKKGRGK